MLLDSIINRKLPSYLESKPKLLVSDKVFVLLGRLAKAERHY